MTLKQANNYNVTFWGCLIMSQVVANIYVAWAFLAFAAFQTIRAYKQSNEQSKTDLGNSGCGESCGVHGSCEQSDKPKQRRVRTKTTPVSCG